MGRYRTLRRGALAFLSLGLIAASPVPASQAASAVVAPAEVSPPTSMEIEIHGDKIVMPTPKGFCPREASDSAFRYFDEMSKKVPIQLGAFLAPCQLDAAATATPFAVALLILQGNRMPDERTKLLAALVAELKTAKGELELQSGIREGAAAAKTAGDAPVDISPQLIDSDDYGIFLSVLVHGRDANAGTKAVMIISVTEVDGYIFYYAFLARQGSPSDAAAILAMAKRETKRFVEANDVVAG